MDRHPLVRPQEELRPHRGRRRRLAAGAAIKVDSVGTEVNTMFANLVKVLSQIDPAKLNGVLSALADGLRGHGAAIGQGITDANEVLLAVNPRAETIRADTRAAATVADTYSAASTNQGAMMQDQSGDASYGGVSMGTTSWGNSGMNDSASSKPCTRGPQCNIFFGN